MFLGPFRPVSGVIEDTDADATVTGTSDSALVGSAVRGIGDVNGDGFEDVAVAANNATLGHGKVYVFFGPYHGETSLSWRGASLDPANADLVISGASLTAERAGYSVSGVGDLDGDGFDDFLVGAPVADRGTTFGAGAAYLFYGDSSLTGALGTAAADATFYGDTGGVGFADAVAGIGDWDRDGNRDLAFGAPDYDYGSTNTGAVFVMLGGGSTRFSGTYTLSSTSADCFLYGNTGDRAGTALAPEVLWDGTHAALAIGVPERSAGGTHRGAVFVYTSSVCSTATLIGTSTGGLEFRGEEDNGGLGTSLDTVPDADGDGKDDLVAGAPTTVFVDHVDGAAYWIPGGSTPGNGEIVDAGATPLCGPVNNDINNYDPDGAFGWAVAGGRSAVWNQATSPDDADQWDTSGSADIAVGAPEATTHTGTDVDDAGQVWVFEGDDVAAWTGPDCLDSAKFQVYGNQDGEELGKSVALVGDLSLDGLDELLVGQPTWDDSVSHVDRGRASIVLSTH